MLLDLIAAERAEKENWKINWVRIEVDEKNIFFFRWKHLSISAMRASVCEKSKNWFLCELCHCLINSMRKSKTKRVWQERISMRQNIRRRRRPVFFLLSPNTQNRL